MGKNKDLLINGATDEEMNMMIDNARDQWSNSYIKFLEEQLEIKDNALKEINNNSCGCVIDIPKNSFGEALYTYKKQRKDIYGDYGSIEELKKYGPRSVVKNKDTIKK